MITALAAAVLAIAAATRIQRWWFSRSWTLAGAVIVLLCMSIHMALNVKTVESAVRVTLGAGIPGAIKMLLVCGICVGTAIVFTTVTSSRHLKKLLWLHISLSVVTAALSFYFFFKTPWPASNPDNRAFDNQYAFLPGYAEGLMLGMAYPFLLCLMVTIVAIRQADRRTATGWGLIIISPGAAALSAYAALRIGYLGSARWGLIDPTLTPFAISRFLAVVGVLFVAAGVLVTAMGTTLVSRAQLRAFDDLRSELLARWPGALRPSEPGSGAADRAADRAAELLDALSLEAKRQALPNQGAALSRTEVAHAVAEWIITDRIPEGLGSDNLRARAATSDVRWARELGDAYAREIERKLVLEQ